MSDLLHSWCPLLSWHIPTVETLLGSPLSEKKEENIKYQYMARPVNLYTSSILPWRKPIIETQWTDSLEIYQKWFCAVNEKAMASPLPIYHQWCIADKPRGSNKLLLRGWPHWWKWKLPHGHPSIHSPLFSIQQSELVSIQGTSYLHDYFLGVGVCVCVCALTEKNKHTICLFTWGGKSAFTQHQCWKVKSKSYSHITLQMCILTMFKLLLFSFSREGGKYIADEHLIFVL